MGIKGFFSRFFKASSGGITDLLNPIWWSTDLFGGRKTYAGTRIDPANALTISAYYAILRNISEDVAKMPVKVYQQKEKAKTFLPSHPVYRLLNIAPNEEMDPITFRETLTHHAIGWGNGYAEIERSRAGDPLALHPIHPSRVSPWRENGKIVYKVRAGGTGLNGDTDPMFMELPPEDMFHVKGLGAVGYVGYSPVQLASEALGLALAAQTYGATFFGNGATPGIVLSHPNKLSDAAAKRLRESWQEQTGADLAHKPKVLEEGMKIDRLTIPPNEAQSLETRMFQLRDIARFLRFPLHKLNDLERATFSNIEQLNIEYATDTLSSWTTRWDQQTRSKLLKQSETDIHIQHDFSVMLRGDQAAQANYINTRSKTGNMTINEMREFYGDDPVADGDIIMVPVNMMPLERMVNPPPDTSVSDTMDDEAGEGDETKEVEPVKDAKPGSKRDVFLLVAEDAALRVLTKETRALENAFSKYKTVDAFTCWANDFYGKQNGYLKESFSAIGATIRSDWATKARQARVDDLCGKVSGIWKHSALAAYSSGVDDYYVGLCNKAEDVARLMIDGIMG